MTPDLAIAIGRSAPSLDGVPMPVWIYAYQSNRFAWANRAALDFWGVPDLESFRAVDLSDTRSETLARLDGVLERLADGGAVVETWTFYPRGRPATVSCAVWLIEWEGETCLASMALPIVAADAEGELARRDAILQTVADGARRLLDGQGWGIEGRGLIDRLGAVAGIDRCYFFRFLNGAAAEGDLAPWSARQELEWCAEGVPPEIDNPDLQAVAMSEVFPRWIEHFLEGRPVVAAGREQMPPTEREFLGRQGIIAICVHPVSAGGELLGFLGFDIVAGPTRSGFEGWSTHSVEALATGAHLIGATLRMEASRARLNQALVDAERANRAKSDFLASMSHDLRTPLNAIIGFADLMLVQADMPDKQAEYLTDIREAGRHLLEMIDDILDLSKIEAGRMVLREEAVDPETMVDGVVRLMQGRVVASRLTLDRGDRRYGWALTCDPRLVRQMLLNLVGNAVKFTPDGGTLAIACEPADDGGVAIVVGDTGPGMAADQLAQALRPFETADARVARPGEANGTGLGLFLVDRMMRLHGGALAIDTAPGQGLTARLVFPAERCLATGDATNDD